MVVNMTTVLTETNLKGDKLVFEFSDNWQACKYDELPFYHQIKNKGLKAVDFIAVSDKGLLLMELKYVLSSDEKSTLRFTEDRDGEKVQKIKALLTPAQQKTVIIKSSRPYLADEVSHKIKDTLLGLLSAYRKNNADLLPYSQKINKPILVLLFLERNEELNKDENFKPLASSLKLAITQKLNFLGDIEVSVVNSLTFPKALDIKILENSPHTERGIA